MGGKRTWRAVELRSPTTDEESAARRERELSSYVNSRGNNRSVTRPSTYRAASYTSLLDTRRTSPPRQSISLTPPPPSLPLPDHAFRCHLLFRHCSAYASLNSQARRCGARERPSFTRKHFPGCSIAYHTTPTTQRTRLLRMACATIPT